MFSLRNIFVFAVVLNVFVNSATAGAVQSIPASVTVQKLRWKDGPIRVSISRSMLRSAPNVKSDSDVLGAVRRSLDAWQKVADIEFIEEVTDRQSVSPSGGAGEGVSLITIAATPENVLMFGKGDDETAAKTRVFFRRSNITEADIVLSPFQQFSTDGTYGTFDLEATLKHEIGHLLGLRHSSVVGSIMYDVSAKGGVYGDNVMQSGRLTQDDISAIRDLYGFKGDESCCSVLNGRLAGIGKNARSIDVWLQESGTGVVVGHGTASKDGSFRIGGLERGTFEITARENGHSADFSIFRLGQVTIENGESVVVTRKLVHRSKDFSVLLIGKNGILSDSPLILRRGNSYTLYLGGKNLSSGRHHIETDSPFLNIDRDTLTNQDYDDGISGLSFALAVGVDSPAGNYNVCAVSDTGVRDCIVGGISIVD